MAKQFFKEIFLVFFSVMVVHISGMGQDRVLHNIRNQFDKAQLHGWYEKIFVHTDKSFYLTGEVIWFKLYQTDGYLNKPVNLSKLSYVEILSKDHKPVLQAKIAMNLGTGSGSFLLPPSLSSGNYLLRAYTNWMKNFPSTFYFEKEITIVNSLKRPEWKTENAAVYDLQFFPEGGNLVEGLKSKVAFKIVDQFGKGIQCAGIMLDEKNDTVAAIQTLRFGIGSFVFIPKPGKTYTAKMDVGNTIVTKSLPTVYNKGHVINLVALENDQLQVTASSNSTASGEPVYLFVHTRHLVKAAMMKPLENGTAIFIIDKKELAEGVSHFTLFNELRQPLCERLFFKRPAKKISIDIRPDRIEYGTKDSVQINFTARSNANYPLPANMSVSVFLLDSLQLPEQSDIFSYLWLDADLKGAIESPAYYCIGTGKETDEAADNLMLTHGWRRFNWKDILENTTPSFNFLPEYEGHLINGKLISKNSGMPANGIATFLSIPGKHFQFSNAVSDEKGNLRFIVSNFYGSEEIITQTNFKKDSGYSIDLSSPFSEDTSSTAFSLFELSEKSKDQLVSRSIGVQVPNTYFPDSIRQFFYPQLPDTTSFYGKPDKEYLLDDYTRFVSMEEVLREFVSEVRLQKRQDHYHFEVRNAPYKTFFEYDPLVLLDGVPVFDIDRIVSFDPLKIKKIEVVTQRYYYGPLVNNGIVSYKTYDGDLDGFQLDPGSLIVEYEGLQLQRQFYSPVYDFNRELNTRIPDFRNVLYWSPEIITNTEGKGQLTFFTSEIPGKYAVVVQGITHDGFSGSSVATFSVNNSPKAGN